MSVLKLRRDMVVVKEEPAVEIETPFPLRTIEPDTLDAEISEFIEEDEREHEDRPRRSFFGVVRFWFNALVIVSALAAYPVLTVLSSDVGDRDFAGSVDRTSWTAPWAGGASVLMEKHFDRLGWASDAPDWAPMARLTAKPAFQAAMAGSIGDFIKLENTQAIASGRPDPDLEAASRLVSTASTGVQLRAARDALVNHDRRMRRRSVPVVATPAQLADQIQLMGSWAATSQTELAAAASTAGNSAIDETATRSVYAAKGRAMAAYVFLDTMLWPENSAAATARTSALQAWKAAAEFHPLIVLNGTPDGSVFGNHAASMGFLIGQAKKATDDFLALATPAPHSTAPQPAATIANAVTATAVTAAAK